MSNHGKHDRFVTVAMGLGFLGLVLLLIFIHHASSVIQVADVTAHLAMQTMQTIDLQSRGWMSEPLEEEGSPLIRTPHSEEIPAHLRASHAGYVQRIALSNLVKDLQHCSGLYLHLLVCPGDFVTEETVMEIAAPLNIQEYQDLLTEITSTLASKSMMGFSEVSGQ